MPVTVDIAHTQKFFDDFIHLAQQKTSRLLPTVRDDPDSLDGKAGYFERLGAVEMTEVTGRNQDTNNTEQPHSRRRILLRDFDLGSMVDKIDARRMKNGAQLPARYLNNAVWAANRKRDDLIIAAANGNAFSMDADDGATAIPLPAAQKILHQGAGLTLAKLLNTKEILDGAEVDEDEARFAIVTSKQVTDMLSTTEVKSADYNTVKALALGQIDTFLGFKFIRTEKLTVDGSGNRLCLFYVKSAIGIATPDPTFDDMDIGPRRDKSLNVQVYLSMSMDATRIEDEKLVQMAYVET